MGLPIAHSIASSVRYLRTEFGLKEREVAALVAPYPTAQDAQTRDVRSSAPVQLPRRTRPYGVVDRVLAYPGLPVAQPGHCGHCNLAVAIVRGGGAGRL